MLIRIEINNKNGKAFTSEIPDRYYEIIRAMVYAILDNDNGKKRSKR